ncbi:MAG TPA: MltA domain-containing protein, partial [Pseudomonadota bacterium]|nr:MltA domain-containing protein [Pseudomonadota bacterium]
LAEYARSTLQPLLALARRGRAALCAALPRDFELHRLAGSERGHFSAYFHPILHGSRTRQGRYQFPLYRRPSDSASQLTTAQILDGGLAGKGLELVYLDSLSTAVNVHIEGSATVQFDDGSEVNLTTDGSNGHPYTNPFKLARKDGIIQAEPPPLLSPPPPAAGSPSPPAPPPAERKTKTRAFFDAHPDLLRIYWAKNPRFIFFKPTPLRGTGKFGQLIAGRSVAVDPSTVPLGAALWMRTELASLAEDAAAGAAARPPARPVTPIARLALAQDTGAAIRGLGRVDVFVGSGAAAQHAASFTSGPGELYLIVRKPAPALRGHKKKKGPPAAVPAAASAAVPAEKKRRSG